MASILACISLAIVLYLLSVLYALCRNLIEAKKCGFPYIIIPWDQNSFFWMAASVPLRPWLKENMPTWVYDRLSLTIYGFEFLEKLRPFKQYAAKQGNDKSYVIVTPGKFEVTTRDPELAIEILRRPKDFQQVDLTALIMGKFGHNLLTTDGDVWSRQRKIVASAINERISKAVFQESLRNTEGMINEVLETETTAETNRLFDLMKKITVNVLVNTGMGADVDWRDSEELKPGFTLTFVQSIQCVLDGVGGPMALPFWFLFNYPLFLPGGQYIKRLSHAIKEFPVHTWDLIDRERKQLAAAHGATRNNIMAQMLDALDQGKVDGQAAKGMSEDEVMGNLFIFSGAGYDTTANTLSFALVLLARYPFWQEWMNEEISSIISEEGTNLDYAAIFPKATRVLACMHETLRLYSPLAHISKQPKLRQTIKTSTGTYSFPANSTVYVNTIGLHLDPTVWRNLNLEDGKQESDTDELIFRPSRWVNRTPDGETIFQPPRGYFLPWSAGPRVCPGQKMAQVEFTAVFLKLFHKHRIEAVPEKVDGKLETRAQVEKRLDERLEDSFPVLTLQMNNVYDVQGDDGKGLKLRLCKSAS